MLSTHIRLIRLTCMLFVAAPVSGQESSPAASPEGARDGTAAAPEGTEPAAADRHRITYGEIDEINDDLTRIEGRGIHLWNPDEYLASKKAFTERTGFNYLVEYAPIFQWGSQGGDDTTHIDQELNLIGLWKLVDSSEIGQGTLMAWFQHSATLNGVTTSEFQASLGVLSPLNGGDTAPDDSANRLQLLAWEQEFNDRLRLVAGKLTTRVLIDANRYAVSDREDFFTPMIVNNTVVPYTARLGLGAFVQFSEDDWYVSAMMREAGGTVDWIEFDALDDGDWEHSVEFALTPVIDGLGAGIYRFTYSYTDAVETQPSGASWSVSFDQDVGDELGAFFRYAYSEDTFRSFRQRVATGVQLKGVAGWEDDRIGIGGWWGDPLDRSLNSEFGLETYWRMQIGSLVQFTPDVQVIFDPTSSDADVRVVGGLRLRIVF